MVVKPEKEVLSIEQLNSVEPSMEIVQWRGILIEDAKMNGRKNRRW